MTEKFQAEAEPVWWVHLSDSYPPAAVDVCMARTHYIACQRLNAPGVLVVKYKDMIAHGYGPEINDNVLHLIRERGKECNPEKVQGSTSNSKTKSEKPTEGSTGSSASTTSKEQPDTQEKTGVNALDATLRLISGLSNTELETVVVTCFASLGTSKRGRGYLWQLRSKLELLDKAASNVSSAISCSHTEAEAMLFEAWKEHLQQSKK